MGVQGFGIGVGGPPPPSDTYNTAADIHMIRDQVVIPKRLKRWKSSNAPQQGATAGTQAGGTVWQVDTGEDEINCLTITVISGTLSVYLFDSEGAGIPDFVCGALSPNNPIEVALTRDRYQMSFLVTGDTKYSVLGKAI